MITETIRFGLDVVSPPCYTRKMDLHRLGIETLLAQGNERSAALAQEIERGLERGASAPPNVIPRINPLNVQGSLNKAREIYFAQQRARHEKEDSQREANWSLWRTARSEMLRNLRLAELGEYATWMRGYLRRGGQPTHFYDYPEPGMWVATDDIVVRPLYGALSFDGIIVPRRVDVQVEGLGHNAVYLMRGLSPLMSHIIPVYRDTEV